MHITKSNLPTAEDFSVLCKQICKRFAGVSLDILANHFKNMHKLLSSQKRNLSVKSLYFQIISEKFKFHSLKILQMHYVTWSSSIAE